MNTRIKELRKRVGLSQSAFGAPIGASRDQINNVENGRATITDMMVLAICKEYGVSEIWLRTGAGDPFPPTSRKEEMTALFAELLNDRPEAFRSKLITALLRFDPSGPEWDVLERIYEGIQAEANKKD